MNRRSFLKAMLSAAGAVAAAPYVPTIIRDPVQVWYNARSRELAIALANSVRETKFHVAARVFGDLD